MPFNKAEYDQQYRRDHIITKLLPFNKDKPEDLELLRYAESKGKRKFTEYIKNLIREDMDKEKP